MIKPPPNNNEEINTSYSFKPHTFNGEIFEYWKDILYSLFISQNIDLWKLVCDDYIDPKDVEGKNIPFSFDNT